MVSRLSFIVNQPPLTVIFSAAGDEKRVSSFFFGLWKNRSISANSSGSIGVIGRAQNDEIGVPISIVFPENCLKRDSFFKDSIEFLSVI